MTRSHQPEIEPDVAGDHHPPPGPAPALPGSREAERHRLAEDIAWLVHRWIRMGKPTEGSGELPEPPDESPPA
jgi:hypothetical protein